MPGIGEYTSSAIASFAYGKEELIIDTNIDRFINRIFNVKVEDLSTKKTKYLGEKIFLQKIEETLLRPLWTFQMIIALKLTQNAKFV